MVHKNYLFSGLLLLFLFFSCSKDITGGEVQIPMVSIIESIPLDTGNDFVRIFYFNEHSFVGTNMAMDKVYIFDKSGKSKRIIDQKGAGPQEYKKIVKFGLSSSGDVVIVDGSKVLFFPNESEEVISCPLNMTEVLPLPHDVLLFENTKGDFLFTSSSMKYSPQQKTYFEASHTITSFSKNCEFTNIGGYPEASLYREKQFITAFEPIIFVAPGENKIYQIFPHELKIFVMNMSGSLLKTIPISPDQFGPVTYRKEKTMENMVYLLQKNSRFRHMIVGKKHLLLQYMKSLPDEQVSGSLAGYNKNGASKREQVFSLYDKSGNKLGADFLNEDMSALIGFDDQNYLWFQKVKEDESVVVCKAKIVL